MQWRGSGFRVPRRWFPLGALAAAGLLVMAFLDVRWGGRLMAAAFLIGAVIRLVARPARKAGGLTVRSRPLDVVILLTLGLGVLIASATVNIRADVPDRSPVGRTSR